MLEESGEVLGEGNDIGVRISMTDRDELRRIYMGLPGFIKHW